jgi:hypothetical protein
MRVARTIQGLSHRNTLVFRKVKVYFQLHPGTHGEPATRGIAGVEWTLRVSDRVVARGTTAEDGSIDLLLPAGQPAELEAFATRYAIVMRGSLEDVATVEGQQRRLSLLGYYADSVDGMAGKNTAVAVLNFQADHAIKIRDNKVLADTRDKLVEEVGK